MDEPLTPYDRIAPIGNGGTPINVNASEVSIGDAACTSDAESDNLFAIRYADPSKSLSECCQFILNEVKRQGVSVMTNDEVFSLATHYWDGDCTAEEIGKPINCKVVISKDQLTEEDKATLKEQAMEQFKDEQLRELRRQSAPKAQPKPTATAPKAGAEINVQPNLFDF